jgi:hypothetical protein
MVTLSSTSHRLPNAQLVLDDCRFQIVFVAICLIIFEAPMNVSFIVKVENSRGH